MKFGAWTVVVVVLMACSSEGGSGDDGPPLCNAVCPPAADCRDMTGIDGLDGERCCERELVQSSGRYDRWSCAVTTGTECLDVEDCGGGRFVCLGRAGGGTLCTLPCEADADCGPMGFCEPATAGGFCAP